MDWGQCLGVSFLYWRSQRSAVSLKYNPSLILGPRRGQVFCHSLLFSSKTRSLSEPSATLLFLRGQTKAQKHLVTSSNVGQSLALSPGPLRWLLLGGSFRPPPAPLPHSSVPSRTELALPALLPQALKFQKTFGTKSASKGQKTVVLYHFCLDTPRMPWLGARNNNSSLCVYVTSRGSGRWSSDHDDAPQAGGSSAPISRVPFRED